MHVTLPRCRMIARVWLEACDSHWRTQFNRTSFCKPFNSYFALLYSFLSSFEYTDWIFAPFCHFPSQHPAFCLASLKSAGDEPERKPSYFPATMQHISIFTVLSAYQLEKSRRNMFERWWEVQSGSSGTPRHANTPELLRSTPGHDICSSLGSIVGTSTTEGHASRSKTCDNAIHIFRQKSSLRSSVQADLLQVSQGCPSKMPLLGFSTTAPSSHSILCRLNKSILLCSLGGSRSLCLGPPIKLLC